MPMIGFWRGITVLSKAGVPRRWIQKVMILISITVRRRWISSYTDFRTEYRGWAITVQVQYTYSTCTVQVLYGECPISLWWQHILYLYLPESTGIFQRRPCCTRTIRVTGGRNSEARGSWIDPTNHTSHHIKSYWLSRISTNGSTC